MSSGSGGGPSTQTVNQNSIPDWLQPYAMQMFGNASSLTMGPNSGYQPYMGQRQANYNPMQRQAMTNLQQMQPSSQLNQATGMTGLAGMRLGQMGNYKPSQVTTMDYIGANVDKYMSPYMNDVVNVQKKNATADYARSMPNMNAGAGAAGALGSSRAAIQQSEQGRNLANQLEGIQATGSQAAFQNAQQQFNAQQQAQEQAAMANQNAGLTANGQNIQSVMGQLQAGGQMAQIGMNDYQQRSGINNAQLGLGQYMQQQEQSGLNNKYQDYLAGQNYPYSQLQFMNSLVHGFAPNTSSTVYGGQPNTLGQVAGLAGGVAGLSNVWS